VIATTDVADDHFATMDADPETERLEVSHGLEIDSTHRYS
jgi:hypothetical protein